MKKHLLPLLTLLLSVWVGGCTTLFRPLNQPVKEVADSNGYSIHKVRNGDLGDNVVLLAFSGGGTRAAALSYGVLKELRDTSIQSRGQRIRLLDDVDSISSVSGGSFTAAYYGLFGDKIFTDYEDVFLKQSIQGILIQQLFDPSYWWRSVSTGFDRTEMAIEYYDSNIFEGKSFRDIDLEKSPFIEINATNLGTASRFSFTQVYFDLLCSDLLDLKVARAVTASSAVPIMFAPVVLKNYNGECDALKNKSLHRFVTDNDTGPRITEIKERIGHYQNRAKYPYVQLIDGGLSDNLGVRALSERLEGYQNGLSPLGKNKFNNILVIVVDAEVEPVHNVDEQAEKPSIADTMAAFSNIQFELFNNESRILLDTQLAALKKQLDESGSPVNVFRAGVSFKNIAGKSLKDHLNGLPTSLELPPGDVDLLVQVGADLLRRNSAYRDFLRAVDGQRGPVSSASATVDLLPAPTSPTVSTSKSP